MSKKEEGGVYDIAFNERRNRIAELELRSRQLCEDIEDCVKEYIKAGGPKKLKRKKRKYTSALDGLR